MKKYDKAIVVLSGARDGYQLPIALDEGNLLQNLVTDLYWPADRKWFFLFTQFKSMNNLIAARYRVDLDSRKVIISGFALFSTIVMTVFPKIKINRFKDKYLSKKSKDIAAQSDWPLFCYSYYAHVAFTFAADLPKYRFIFQLHPHPQTLRQIFLEEIERVPQAKSSLLMEHELSLTADEFDDLAEEPHLANGWVVASTYTAGTLAEHGIPQEQIHVVPYGVNSSAFPCRPREHRPSGPFTLIFVGSMIQRKGLSYLLDAMRALKDQDVRLILCGRGLIDQDLLAQYSDLQIEINIGLPREQLIQLLWQSDVFVFPSLAEGFAHVILEAMSCGLPIITTDHTCGPDVIDEGTHGFIVPIRDVKAITTKVEWGIEHRQELFDMGQAAAVRARSFTWERFRAGIRDAYIKMIDAVNLGDE